MMYLRGIGPWPTLALTFRAVGAAHPTRPRNDLTVAGLPLLNWPTFYDHVNANPVCAFTFGE